MYIKLPMLLYLCTLNCRYCLFVYIKLSILLYLFPVGRTACDSDVCNSCLIGTEPCLDHNTDHPDSKFVSDRPGEFSESSLK